MLGMYSPSRSIGRITCLGMKRRSRKKLRQNTSTSPITHPAYHMGRNSKQDELESAIEIKNDQYVRHSESEDEVIGRSSEITASD
jgi:hypothetical protein